ncbi:MAG: T9SS type A sorting domain-containing protein [Fidelibacterota bacterium]
MDRINNILVAIFTATLQFLLAESYNWPCVPFDEQHGINGTFCENRSGSSGSIDHFHDGVDIHLSVGGQVYSVINGTVTSIGWPGDYGINSWVRVGRYAYVHVNPVAGLSVGDPVIAFETVLGSTNSWNHIHFKDGYPDSEINALRTEGGLDPFQDLHDPAIMDIRFYMDESTTQFSNNRVYGLVDIISRAADITDTGPYGGNNGIYKIGFDIIDQNDSIVAGPRLPFQFDEIPASDSYVHNVFHDGSTTSIYHYIVSNHLTYNGSVDVSDWEQGFYTARVYTWDTMNNTDTLTAEFEVTEQDNSAPEPPILLSVLGEDNGFRIRWLPNSEEDLAGYRLYFSFDMETWTSNHDETILTDTTTKLVVASFPQDMAIYFKLTAVDNAPFPNESDPSDIYGLRLGNPNEQFVIIDAFDNENSVWQESSHPFVALIGNNLDRINIPFSTVNDELFDMDTTYTLPPGKIIYSLDDFNPLPISLLQRLRENLSGTWLTGGGLLQGLSSDSLGSLYLEELAITLGSLEPTPAEITGMGGRTFTLDTSWYILDSLYTISIDPFVGSTILEDNEGRSFGVQAYQFLFTVPPPEMLFGPEPDEDLLEEIVWLLLGDLQVGTPSSLPESFAINAYPNPFNPLTTIRLDLPVEGRLTMTIYDILGHEVEEIVSSKIVNGEQEVMWQRGGNASGVYILKADFTPLGSRETFHLTRKIALLK